MDILIIGIISYLMGSIPFGLILTKIFLKKDIRDIGSGNIGATNVLRAGNKTVGYITLSLDILKAVIPVIYVKIYHTDFLYLASLCAFIGHVFPVWLKFKGGKGVATYVGILCAISIYFGIIFVLSWFVIFAITKFSSLLNGGDNFKNVLKSPMSFSFKDKLLTETPHVNFTISFLDLITSIDFCDDN